MFKQLNTHVACQAFFAECHYLWCFPDETACKKCPLKRRKRPEIRDSWVRFIITYVDCAKTMMNWLWFLQRCSSLRIVGIWGMRRQYNKIVCSPGKFTYFVVFFTSTVACQLTIIIKLIIKESLEAWLDRDRKQSQINKRSLEWRMGEEKETIQIVKLRSTNKIWLILQKLIERERERKNNNFKSRWRGIITTA